MPNIKKKQGKRVTRKKRKAESKRLYRKLDYGASFEARVFAQARKLFAETFSSRKPVDALAAGTAAAYTRYSIALDRFYLERTPWSDNALRRVYNNKLLTASQRVELHDRLWQFCKDVRAVTNMLRESNGSKLNLARRLFALRFEPEDLPFIRFAVSDREIIAYVSSERVARKLAGRHTQTTFHDMVSKPEVPVAVLNVSAATDHRTAELHEKAHSTTKSVSVQKPNDLLQALVNEHIAELSVGEQHFRSSFDSEHIAYYLKWATRRMEENAKSFSSAASSARSSERKRALKRRAAAERKKIAALEEGSKAVSDETRAIRKMLLRYMKGPYYLEPGELARILKNIPAQKVRQRLPEIARIRLRRKRKRQK